MVESKEHKYVEPHLTRAGEIFRDLFKRARKASGFNQTQLAERLKMSQVLVSRCEVGERKIDVLELREICRAMNVDFVDFVTNLDRELSEHEKNPKPLGPVPIEHTRRKK